MKFIKIILLAILPIIAISQPKRDTVRVKARSHSVIIITQSTDSIDAIVDNLPVASYGDYIQFDMSIPYASNVSAGLYKGDSLIRTFFNNKRYEAGTYTEQHKALTDNFDSIKSLVGLDVKYLYSNVHYTWNGVIGNTSREKSGPTVHKGYFTFNYLQTYGGRAYYAGGYSEGSPSQRYFDLTDIQASTHIFENETWGTSQTSNCLAVDGDNVYWAGTDSYAPGRGFNADFVFATKVSDNTEYLFPTVTPYKCVVGRTYKSVLDMTDTSRGLITGIAVSSNFLFTCRKDMNLINVYDKSTWVKVATFTVSAPVGLTTDPSGNLWVLSGTSAFKYSVSVGGDLTLIGSITGLKQPKAIAVTTNGVTVSIADGGTSQQIKSYSNSTFALTNTFGQLGGYYTSAAAAYDKFYFSDDRAPRFGVSLQYQSDGSLWVCDGGNYRAIHYDASRNYIEHIQAMPQAYSAWVSQTDSSRVFCDFIEFSVDYSKDLSPSNGSWTFVKNWGSKIIDSFYTKFGCFKPIKFPNGKTYTSLNNYFSKWFDVYELTSADTLRYTGTRLYASALSYNEPSNLTMGDDANLYFSSRKVPVGNKMYFRKRLLQNNNANPTWGGYVMMDSVVFTGIEPFWTGNGFNLNASQFTSDGGIVVWDGNSYDKNYHLGVLKNSKWKFKTSRSTYRKYLGEFPKDGWFDIGNKVAFSGNLALTKDHSIIWGYNGEFWKDGQTTMFNHYYDNGLMVGQFGVTRDDTLVRGFKAPPGLAGNARAINLVKSGSNYYIYCNDESWHSGVHQWKITGLDSITEVVATPSLTNPSNPGIDLMGVLPWDSSFVNNTNGWVLNPSTYTYDITNNYWEARTGVKAYDLFTGPDMCIRYRSAAAAIRTAAKTIGTINDSSWSLDGKINYDGGQYNYDLKNITETGLGGVFFDVLDANGKVILRFYIRRNTVTKNVDVMANNTVIATGPFTYMNELYKTFQTIRLTVTGSTIQCKYGSFAAVTIPKFDATVSLNLPKTIKLTFFTGYPSQNDVRAISFKELKFYN